MMVLTRLSHLGEVCPLSDHSYSDPSAAQFSRVSAAGSGSKSPSNNASSSSASSPSPSGDAATSQPAQEVAAVASLHILDLPNEIFEKIFTYLTYKKVGETRQTCKRFEQVGSSVLNTAFQRLQHTMSQRFQAIKGQMPRRESSRRKHPLVREHDIVETLHMRLMLLQMSFGKHIERKHCCFFAGDILDEVHRILCYIKNTPTLNRAYKVTDELFDLSSMAMEYFKEHIEPRLPEITCFGSDFLDITTRYPEGCGVRGSSGSARVSEPEDDIPEFDPLPPSNMVLRKRIRRIRQGMRRYNTQLVALKRELKSCKSKLTDQHKQMLEYATRMDEYDKKFEESSRKFSTVLQELNKCKTELQYWRSKSPAHPLLCYSCGQSVGEGANQPLQAGVLMQGVEETVVFVPLAKAPADGERAGPLFGRGGRELCGGSVKNLERVFDLDLTPPELDVKEPDSKAMADLPTNGDLKPQESSAKIPTEVPTMAKIPLGNVTAPISQPPPCPNLHCLSSVSIPTSSTHPTTSTPHLRHALPSPQFSSPSSPMTPHTSPLPHASTQPYSAFHIASESCWSQECAEDLSMSRSNHDLEDDSECGAGTLKRRSGDEESDNCETNDDTVGRRVKSRKRIKVDIL